jgi:thiol-disulfide isomerase/thioredoxin
MTPSGLLGVDSRALFARVRRSPAKGVVVNAWASWCGSCKGDIPLLLGLPKTFGRSIEVLLVSVDEPESQPGAMRMLRDFGAPLPSYVVDEPLGAFKEAMNPRWPGMLPATFLFDTAGKLHYFWGGPILPTDVVPLLRRYVAGEPVDGEANFALAPGALTR